jgi:hypothetical protein
MATMRRKGHRKLPKFNPIMAGALGCAGVTGEFDAIPVQTTEFIIGQKGSGKTMKHAFGGGGSISNKGSWENGNTYLPFQQQPPYNDPPFYTDPHWEIGWKLGETKPESVTEQPKYSPEEKKGRLIAYATVRIDGVEHTGILFVRRCGAWKLVDCETLFRVASGSAGSKLPDHTIKYYIYQDTSEKQKELESKNQKPKRKPGRFDDLEVVD